MGELGQEEETMTNKEESMKLGVSFEYLPFRFHGSIERYLSRGIPLGSFLEYCMANDLVGAYGRADDFSLSHMKNIVMWLYNHCPWEARGSERKVDEWMSARKETPFEIVDISKRREEEEEENHD
jgi:hypothetical protein